MCTALIVAMILAALLVWSKLFRQACLAAVLLFALIAFFFISAASAQRESGNYMAGVGHPRPTPLGSISKCGAAAWTAAPGERALYSRFCQQPAAKQRVRR
jgi:predicted LPLAT superfamily acyltransferase